MISMGICGNFVSICKDFEDIIIYNMNFISFNIFSSILILIIAFLVIFI